MSIRTPANENSAALLQRYREDRSATDFLEILQRYGGLVKGTAARILAGDHEAARDVAQAVFADLARLAGELSPKVQLGGWLHRHTVFLAMRQRRTDARRRLREDEAARRWALDESDVEPPAWAEQLDAALDRLPAADRQVLVLRYLENQPLQQVGAMFGLNADAAQKRVSRALEKLRSRLGLRGAVSALTALLTTVPKADAALAKSALAAAASSPAPSAGYAATFLAMNLKSAAIVAATAAAITLGVLWPMLSRKDRTIDRLESELSALRQAPPPKSNPLPKAAAAASPQKPRPVSVMNSWQERSKAASTRVKEWTDAISQIEDAARKNRALAEVREAMESVDDAKIFEALSVWRAVGNVEFDRGAFRPALLALLEHRDPLIRATALGTLPVLPKDSNDVERTISMAKDEDEIVRQVVVSNLFWLTNGDLTGRNGGVALGILQQVSEPNINWYGALWGARFSPELEALFVFWGNQESEQGTNGSGYRVMYQSLSTQNNKGPACVDLLLNCLTNEDTQNIAGRAAWGLGYGVAPNEGSEKKIADTAIKVWRNRHNAYVREKLLKCVEAYGTAEHATQLDELAASPALGEEAQKQLTRIADRIRSRPDSPPVPSRK